MNTLAPFKSVDLAALRWVRDDTEERAFRLLSGEQPIARLRWSGPVGSLATFESLRGTWTYKRGGFLAPHVSARATDRTEAARLTMHGAHGLLQLGTGTTYRFRRAGMLLPAWQLSAADGADALHIEPVEKHGRPEGSVLTVAPPMRSVDELDVLVGVTWYFIVLAWLEEAAVLAGSAVLSAVSPP